MAFGATLVTPHHHHEARHARHSVADEAKGAQSNQGIPGEIPAQASAANHETVRDPKFLGMNAKVGMPNAGMPNAEWDCSNGDAGCSWHPEGWEGTRN
jgi:hypothetical protein